MPFEYVVRPFQSRDSLGRTILPAAPGGIERATLTWGSQHAASATLPTPKSMGVNIQCCNEVITQKSNEASPVSIQLQGPDVAGATIPVKRTDVVLAKKKETNQCDDWLMNNSYVASGVSQAFSEMSSLIHASDAAFLPSGSNPECQQKTTWKYDGVA